MKLLLAGQFDAGEEDTWRAALQTALRAQGIKAELLNPAQAQHAAGEVVAAFVANPPPGSLQGLRALRLVQSLWAGVDRLLADATLPAGVPLARMVDPAMNAAMAETALWAVLSLHRHFFTYAAQQRQGLWQPRPQRRADELRVLVLGQGQMGSTAAARLAQQGYSVSGWRRDGQPLAPQLAQADIVINLLPLTPATRGLLNAAFFAALPRGAGVVNLARGAHVVDEDLLAALRSGHVGHAVLDVFHQEPLPAAHAYWQHPQVTLLPHAAAATDPRSAARVAAANVHAVLAGGEPAHRVDRTRAY